MLSVLLGVAFLAPVPYKTWGDAGAITFIASLMLFRVAELFTGKRAFAFLPYIIATFLALVLVLVFAPDLYSHIALIVFLGNFCRA